MVLEEEEHNVLVYVQQHVRSRSGVRFIVCIIMEELIFYYCFACYMQDYYRAASGWIADKICRTKFRGFWNLTGLKIGAAVNQ